MKTHRGSQDRQLSRSERLEAGFDPRLADVWLAIFQYSDELAQSAEAIAPFLRMAYLSGYSDGSSEKQPGALFAEVGDPQ